MKTIVLKIFATEMIPGTHPTDNPHLDESPNALKFTLEMDW